MLYIIHSQGHNSRTFWMVNRLLSKLLTSWANNAWKHISHFKKVVLIVYFVSINYVYIFGIRKLENLELCEGLCSVFGISEHVRKKFLTSTLL